MEFLVILALIPFAIGGLIIVAYVSFFLFLSPFALLGWIAEELGKESKKMNIEKGKWKVKFNKPDGWNKFRDEFFQST